ncbi:MAG: hypothetical protein C0403_01940 [Desulfobacterium sp.]|nr:hypothetical protein [Desulfobacterium sp.]
MLRRFLTQIFVFQFIAMVCSLFFVSEAKAFGLGLTLGKTFKGFASYEYKQVDNFPHNFDNAVDYNSSDIIFGVALDTNLSKYHVYNYRLEIQRSKITLTDSNSLKTNMDKWTMDHNFGFQVYQDPLVRIWIGPQIRISYAKGDSDIEQTGLGLSPLIGMNLNPDSIISPSLTIGFRNEALYGSYKEPVNSDGNIRKDRKEFVSYSRGIFINMSLFFRIDE